MFLTHLVDEGQSILAQKIKALVLREFVSTDVLFSKKLSGRLLLEPELFAYFNSQSKDPDDLSRILFGYLKSDNTRFSVLKNSSGVINLPNYGYIITRPSVTSEKNQIIFKDDKLKLKQRGAEVGYTIQQITYIKGTKIEIKKYPHVFSDGLIEVIEKVGKKRLKSTFKLTTERNISYYLPKIEQSIDLIRVVSPYQYREVLRLCRQITLLKGVNLIAFTAIDMHGAIFIRPRKTDTRIFFAEHIIHEVSHIALNLVLLNINDFFTIDPFEKRFSSPFRKDLRGVYQVIQAAFVLAKIAQFYDRCLALQSLDGDEYYEVVGRFMLAMARLKDSLSYIGEENIYTSKGLKIYIRMENLEKVMREKHSNLFEKYVITNQEIEFELAVFLKMNSISRMDKVHSRLELI